MTIPLYTWYQNGSTVAIKFDVAASIVKADIASEISGSSIKFGVKGYVPHVEGQLSAAIKGSKWLIKEDVGQVTIMLDKSTAGVQWTHLLANIPQSSTFISRARVMYDYEPSTDEELILHPYELIGILSKDESGWWEGHKQESQGVFPSNFVEEFQIDYQPTEDLDQSAEFAKTEESKQPGTVLRKGGIPGLMVDELKGKLSNRRTTSFSPKEVESALSQGGDDSTTSSNNNSNSLSSSSSTVQQPTTTSSSTQPQSTFIVGRPSSIKLSSSKIQLNRTQSQFTNSASSLSSSSEASFTPIQPLPPKQQPPPVAERQPAPPVIERQPIPLPPQQSEKKEPPPVAERQPIQLPPTNTTNQINSSKEMSPNSKKDTKDGQEGGGGNRITSLFKKKINAVANFMNTGEDKSDDKYAGRTRVVVVYDFETDQQGELPLKKGEQIVILAKDGSGWWQGLNPTTGAQGWFSNTFVEELPPQAASSVASPSKDKSKDTKESKESKPSPSSSSKPQYATVEMKLQAIKPETPKLEHKRKPAAARGRKLPSRSRASYLLDPNERAERDKLRAGFYSVSPLRKEDFPDEDEDEGYDSDLSLNSSGSLNNSNGLKSSTGINQSPPLSSSRGIEQDSTTTTTNNLVEKQETSSTSTSPPIPQASERAKPPPPKRNIVPLQLAGSGDSVVSSDTSATPSTATPLQSSTEDTVQEPPTSAVPTTSTTSTTPGATSPPVPAPAKIMKLKPKPSAPPRNPDAKLSSDTSAPPPLAPVAGGTPHVNSQGEEDKEKEKPALPGLVKLVKVKPMAKPPPASAPPSGPEGIDTSKPKLLIPLKRTTSAEADTLVTDKSPQATTPVGKSPPLSTTTDSIDTSKPELIKVLRPVKPKEPAAAAAAPGSDASTAAPAMPTGVPPLKPKVAPRKEPPSQHNRVPSSSSSNPTTPVQSVSPNAPVSPMATSPPQNSQPAPPPSAVPLKKSSPTIPRRQDLTSSTDQNNIIKPTESSGSDSSSSTTSLYSRILQQLPSIYTQINSTTSTQQPFQHQYPSLSSSHLSIHACSTQKGQEEFEKGPQNIRVPMFQAMWPFIYSMLVEDLGIDEIDKVIGNEPQQNDKPYNDQKKAHNPFCTSGALVESNLYTQKYSSPALRISQVLSTVGKLVKGGVSCDMGSYLSQKLEALDEVTCAHLLKSAGLIKSPEDILDFYYQINSITMDVTQISQLATTLSSYGLSPIDDQSSLASKSHISTVLSTMKNCDQIMNGLGGGQLNNGNEMITVSSDSGVLMVIIPGVIGIALQTQGTSNSDDNEKHIQFCKLLKESILS